MRDLKSNLSPLEYNPPQIPEIAVK